MPIQLVVLSVVFAVSLAIGQVMFKLAATQVRAAIAQSWMAAAMSPWLIGALILYAASTALWIYILAQVPLTRAYPFALLGAALVPTIARVALGESLPSLYVLGMLVVVAGVALIQFS